MVRWYILCNPIISPLLPPLGNHFFPGRKQGWKGQGNGGWGPGERKCLIFEPIILRALPLRRVEGGQLPPMRQAPKSKDTLKYNNIDKKWPENASREVQKSKIFLGT